MRIALGRTRRIRFDPGWLGLVFGVLLGALTLAAPHVDARKKAHPAKSPYGRLPITDLNEDEAVLHALNRFGFGPRPGDVERVRQMGLEKWVEAQLNPDRIDDGALNARLERFPTLAMSPSKLLEQFPSPAMAAKRQGLSKEEYRKEREESLQRREEQKKIQDSAELADSGRTANSDKPVKMPEDTGKPAPFVGQRQGFQPGDPNNPPMRLEEARTPQRVIAELAMAKLSRAIYSERQLNEMMVDFWFNHFNVFAGKGADRWLLTSYDREAIRPHAMGKFRDLLESTAKSPAMLFYLDNWLSADPKAFERMERELAERRRRFHSIFGGDLGMYGRLGRGRPGPRQFPAPNPQAGQGQPGQPAKQKRSRGLNENYARELMELHTLGVDGGYTQQDVIEVARCFTGWTMRAPQRNPEFYFDARLHDNGSKVVLGHTIHAGGMKDGEQVLDLLARHPNTAKFVSTKLARRFVSDQPPAALVDRMARTFQQTGGDIRAVLRTMVYSPEFWSRDAYRAKIKSPFELVASTARAVGAEVDAPLPLVMWTARIGEPLYMCQPPTGYSDKAETWVNTGALLNRLNFALALAGNRLRGARVDVDSLLETSSASDPKVILDRAIQLFVAGQVSPGTRETLEKQLTDTQVLRATLDDPVRRPDAGMIAGLVLGAPEFQRR